MKKTIVFFCIMLMAVFAQNGMGDYALNFDGTDDYVGLNSVCTSLNNTTSLTIECWINPNNVTDGQYFLAFNKNDYSNNLQLGISSGTLKFLNSDAGTTSGSTLTANAWYHIALSVADDNTAIVYVNGKEDINTTTTYRPATDGYFSIGQEWDGADAASNFFNGYIDETRIWDDVRTAEEIRENMYKDVTGQSNLVAYYKMSDGSGISLTDNSNNTNTGTLTGGPAWSASGCFGGARQALDFDGDEDYVELSSPLTIGSSSNTVEMWVKVPEVGSGNLEADERVGILLGNWGAGDQTNYPEVGWEIHSLGQLKLYWNNAIYSGTTDLRDNKWHHLAFVRDKGSSKCYAYIDGKIEVDHNGNLPDITFNNNHRIGSDLRQDNKIYFHGQIDELRIWDTAKSQSEIQKSMMKTLVGNETNLIHYYRFDQADGDILYDMVGSNNGILTNMDAATDWVEGNAFSTWIGGESSDWATDANWTDGVPASTQSAGLYKLTLSGITTCETIISGSPSMNSLFLSATSTPIMNSSITLETSLILQRDFNQTSYNITLGNHGYLTETGGTLTGTSGYIESTWNLDNISSVNVANLGAVISTGENMGSTTIRRGYSVQSGAALTAGIERYYDIDPTNNVNATLEFHYKDTELNGITESNLKLIKSDNSGSTWNYAGGTVNTTDNTITLSGINGSSRWTAGLAPEINIQGNGNDIADGDATPSATNYTDFGDIDVDAATQEYTFSIENTGNSNLSITTPISVTGDFTCSQQPANTVTAGGSTTFVIKFDPSATGERTGTVSITNGDGDEGTYNFSVKGTGAEDAGNVPTILTLNATSGTTVGINITWTSGTVTIDWGDTQTSTCTNSTTLSHTYSSDGPFTVEISGSLTKFYITTGQSCLTAVNSFGDNGLTALLFRDCTNLTDVPASIPATVTNLYEVFRDATDFNDPDIGSWDVSHVTNMGRLFYGADNFNQNISNWDVSHVTDMHYMFYNADKFNGNITSWDVSSVTNMYMMFGYAPNFNQNIGGWDVSSVTNLSGMFSGASSFNQDIGNWNINSSATNMQTMFYGASSFNQNISTKTINPGTANEYIAWDVSHVTNMQQMFRNATDFNQNICNWDVGAVENMQQMFEYATNFNQDIGDWDVSNVENMTNMFYHASNFNQDIGDWDVSNVKYMRNLFYFASNFNQDIGSWNTSNVLTMEGIFAAGNFDQDINTKTINSGTADEYVAWDVSHVVNMNRSFYNAHKFNQDISNWDVGAIENMQQMFEYATNFNQDISGWNVTNVTDMANMFTGITLSTTNYDALLNGWANQTVQNNVTFSGGNSRYSESGLTGRNTLTNTKNWTITDGGQVPNIAPVVAGVYGENSSVATGSVSQNVSLLDDATVSNADANDYNDGFLTIVQSIGTGNGSWGVDGTTVTSGGDNTVAADETIAVSGTVIGTVHATNDGQGGNTLQINFNSNATSARIQTLIQNFHYATPSGLDERTFTLTLNDGDGIANGGDADDTGDFTITVINDPMILVVNTTLGSNTVTLPLGKGNIGAVDVIIDWGDGNIDTYNTYGDKSHTYSNEGTYTIQIAGTLERYGYNEVENSTITAVKSFGDIGLTDLTRAFEHVTNLTDVPASLPTTVTNLYRIFYYATSINDPDIGSWDVSNVTNMSGMFCQATSFNQDIGNWDVSNVTDMSSMFNVASSFNQDIGNWNVSNVTTMYYMFLNAQAFNQDINTKVINPGTAEEYIAWDVSNVTNMKYMFYSATNFNGNISSWNTSAVTNMYGMFRSATKFNQNINTKIINAGLPNEYTAWDVSNVTDMNSMFNRATSFDQNIGDWNISNVTNMTNMFYGVTLSMANYDSLLIDWANQTVQNGVVFHGGNSCYSPAGQAGRDILTNATNNWTITDGGQMPTQTGTITTLAADNIVATSAVGHGTITDLGYPTATQYGVCWSILANPTIADNKTELGVPSAIGAFTSDITGLAAGTTYHYRSYITNSEGTAYGADLTFATAETPTVLTVNTNLATGTDIGIDITWTSGTVTIDWGDASTSNCTNSTTLSHTYGSNGTYTIKIYGDLTKFHLTTGESFLTAVNSFGSNGLTDLEFRDCENLTDVPGSIPATITNLELAFYGATAFNDPDISNWNVSNVTNMNSLFSGATSFDQDISDWNVSSVSDMVSMFSGVTLSTEYYDALLNDWAALPVQNGVNFDGGNSQYTSIGKAGRDILTNIPKNWAIADGGEKDLSGIISTQSTDNLTYNSAKGHGNISTIEYPSPIQHGVCWGTAANPTVADSKTELGVPAASGDFSSDITGLTSVTTYHYRAYVTNATGTYYGNDVTFTTLMDNQAPVFTSPATFKVNEGNLGVGIAKATDADGDNITFSITGGADKPFFNINRFSGQLAFKAAQDYENPDDTDQNGIYEITITAQDDGIGNLTTSQSISVVLLNVEGSPMGSDKIITINEDSKYIFSPDSLMFDDEDGDKFAGIQIISSVTKGKLSYNNNTATDHMFCKNLNLLTFQPGKNEYGTPYTTFTFKVKDNSDTYSNSTYTLTVYVTSVNDLPTGKNNTALIDEDTEYTFDSTDFPFTDTESEHLSGIKIITPPGKGCLLYKNNQVTADQLCTEINALTFRPDSNGYGENYASFSFKVMDSDSGLSQSAYTYTISINGIDDPPVAKEGISDINVFEDTKVKSIFIDKWFTDVDNDDDEMTITLKENSAPDIVTVSIIKKIMRMNFFRNQHGTAQIILSVTSNGKTLHYPININIESVNDHPISRDTTLTIKENSDYFFTPENFYFTDVECDTINGVQITYHPGNGSLYYNNKIVEHNIDYYPDLTKLAFRPEKNSTGTPYTSFQFRVCDNEKALSDSVYIMTLNVIEVDDPPYVKNPLSDIIVMEDAPDTSISLTRVFTDVDNYNISKSLMPGTDSTLVIPTIRNDVLRLDYQPDKSGQTSVIIRAMSNQLTVTDTFQVTILPVNDPPKFIKTMPDTTIKENSSLQFQFGAADNDSKTLHFALKAYCRETNQPFTGMHIDSLSGKFSWKTDFQCAGTYLLTVFVSDESETITDTTMITVQNVNRPPQFTHEIPDTTVNNNENLIFQYRATDPDNDALQFGLITVYTDLNFTDDGKLNWKLPENPAASYQLQIYVTDGIDSTISTSLMEVEDAVAVAPQNQGLPTTYTLAQNYPNPFNPTTTIRYALPKTSQVTLMIVDINGNLIRSIIKNEQQSAGYYQVVWDAAQVPSGLYFYQIIAGDFTSVKKCLLIK